jgi:hypothetical protein
LCAVALGEGSASALHDDLIKRSDNLIWAQAAVKGSGGVRAGGVAAALMANHVSGRDGTLLAAEQRSDPDGAIGVGIRKWAEQEGVDDAEDGGVGADAERQRHDDDERQPGTAQQPAKLER